MFEINEKNKHETESNITTRKEYFIKLNSSIFFPNHINNKLEKIVAIAYNAPNCPWDIWSSFLKLGLNSPKKKLCPKLEKKVKTKP